MFPHDRAERPRRAAIFFPEFIPPSHAAGWLGQNVVMPRFVDVRGTLRFAPATRPHHPAVQRIKKGIVLGFDRLEPRVAERLLEEGQLPNLARPGCLKSSALRCPATRWRTRDQPSKAR